MSWLDTLEEIRTRDFSKASEAERDKAAREIVNLCSYAVAVVSVSPIPFSDALLMIPIQAAMVMTVGHVHGRKLAKAEATELILELGAVAGVGFLARQGIKALVPVVGALLTVPAAFAANWAIGRVALEYFKNPGASKEYLRQVYRRAKKEGGSEFSKEKFASFRRRHEDDIRAVAEEQAPTEVAPGKGKAPRARKKAAPRKKAPRKRVTSRAR